MRTVQQGCMHESALQTCCHRTEQLWGDGTVRTRHLEHGLPVGGAVGEHRAEQLHGVHAAAASALPV